MLITDYTSYDEVRAALGVSVDELDDTQLDLPLYVNGLEIDLEDIHVNLPTTYQTVLTQSIQSEDEQRFLKAAKMFATYAVARQLSNTLPLFSPEQITDGKAAVKRFQQDSPFKAVTEAVGREYARAKIRLEQLFAIVGTGASTTMTAKTYFAVSSPSSDPILGT